MISKIVPDRIVSIGKPYIRPLICGKEGNNVDLGAKLKMIKVEGFNFIEQLSFKAFNEGTHPVD